MDAFLSSENYAEFVEGEEGTSQLSSSGSDRSTLAIPVDVVVLGASGSGKTTLVKYFLHKSFVDCVDEEEEEEGADSGAIYYSKTIVINSDVYKFKIWDTAGDDKYKFLLPMYYQSARAAVVVYDASEEDVDKSYGKAKAFIRELREKEGTPGVVALVGTKCDLGCKIPTEEVRIFADQHSVVFREVSSKNGDGVVGLFEQLAWEVRDVMISEGGKESLEQCNILGINSLAPSGSTGTIELPSYESAEEYSSIHVVDEEFGSALPHSSSKQFGGLQSSSDASDGKANRPKWVADEDVKACTKCGTNFSVFLRKHHCRACGKIYCSDCASHYTTIPQMAYKKPVRVCKDCHERLLSVL